MYIQEADLKVMRSIRECKHNPIELNDEMMALIDQSGCDKYYPTSNCQGDWIVSRRSFRSFVTYLLLEQRILMVFLFFLVELYQLSSSFLFSPAFNSSTGLLPELT